MSCRPPVTDHPVTVLPDTYNSLSGVWPRMNRPWSSSPRRRRCFASLCTVTVIMAWTSGATAQPAPRSDDTAVSGMVNSIIESQIPLSSPSARAVANTPRSSSLREIRANLAGFSQELSNLVSVLYQEVNRTSGLRTLMGDALQLNAKATLLTRQSASTEDLSWLQEEYRTVDGEWRSLAFRLQELRGVSPRVEQYLARAEEYHTKLNTLLNVNTQVDPEGVLQHATALSTDLMHLLEEIDFEVSDAQQRYDLLIEGRLIYQQSRRISARAATHGATMEELREEYRRFHEIWAPYVTKLRPMQLRYVDRQLRRAESAERKLQASLMLPTEVDRSELLYLTQLLQRDLDQLMDGVSLRDLTALGAGRDQIVGYASDFYSACSDFADCVRNGESAETMAELYFYLDGHWQRVATLLRNAEPQRARQVYRELSRSIDEIRALLAVQPSIDLERLGHVAAEIENLAGLMERDMRSIITARPTAFPAQFRQDSLRTADTFRRSAHQLALDTATGKPIATLRTSGTRVNQAWTDLLRYVERFPNLDRETLYVTRAQITPAVVQMQATLTP